ncbi:MAG: polyprenyl synthetase family protein [Oscillospiraceae bacterium]|nr:polyprenyl synthetase family protein [Oscillospiraceae bacterium]
MDYNKLLQEDCALVEDFLSKCFAKRAKYGQIYEAMQYSLMAGGKRIRPVLTLETCRMCGGDVTAALPFACAVEMVHTYSLIHDDLPCMDDDDLRRGKPTNHKVFGEATAVLAGDALLTAAFEIMCEYADGIEPGRVLAAVDCLSHAAGAAGMIGGQMLDMDGESRTLSLEELELLQSLKTGALIRAAAELGCIVAGGDEATRQAVRQYAQCVGRAFQVRDDMLDVTSSAQVLGKPIGSDAENEKSTFVSALGLERCGQLVDQLTEQAITAFNGLENTEFHIWLARLMAGREY